MATMTAQTSQQTTPGCGCACGAGCSCGCSACETLTTFERPRFFSGQLLTEQELNGEQAYAIGKNRLHNRLLHGYGVVCGLRVACCDATHVTVEAGYALDPCGNDIVLAESATVDLLRLIRDCRNRARPAGDCNPFLAAQLTGCEGADQTWCLTISYAERDARPAAALRSSAVAPAHAATTPGCGCNGNGNGAPVANGTTVDAIGRNATACEPTRTVETATFGVACLPAETTAAGQQPEIDKAIRALSQAAPPGTLLGETVRCQADFQLMIEARPKVDTPQDAYTAVCRWLKQAKATLAAHPTTRCGAVDDLARIAVPAPPQGQGADPKAYLVQLSKIQDEIVEILTAGARECLCWNLIPGCPPPPTDNCLVLACVTLRNDTIVDICHGWPRRQVVTFPALAYWLTEPSSTKSAWANQLPMFLSPEAFGRTVSLFCCGAEAGTVPDRPEATRLVAVVDLTTKEAPKKLDSGLSPSEYNVLRTSMSALRKFAANLVRPIG